MTLQSSQRFYIVEYQLSRIQGHSWFKVYKNKEESIPFEKLSEAMLKAQEVKSSVRSGDQVHVRSFHRMVQFTQEMLNDEAHDYLRAHVRDWDPAPYDEAMELLDDGKVLVRPEYTIAVVGGD